MSVPLRRRLSLSHLAVVMLGMILAAAFAGLAVEELYLNTQRENLLAQAQLTAAGMPIRELPTAPFFTAEPYSQTSNVEPGIHTRLLGESGAVLFSLPLPEDDTPLQEPYREDPGVVPAEELLQRSEIQAALDGQADTAIRRPFSAPSRRVLYAAAPVRNQEGEVSGLVYLAMPLPAGGLPAGLLLQLVGAVILAAGFSGAAGIWLARGLSRPLEALERAAAAVAAGNLDQRIKKNTSIRELAGLGKTFNRMADHLQRSREIQNAFIADVTHELRTPLTVIKGTVETIEDGLWDDLESRDRLLGAMHRETDRLIRLVQDLLVLTRADAEALQLSIQSVDLKDLAEDRCARFSPLAAAQQVELRLEEDPAAGGDFCVQGDPDRLAQVLDNLLDNAIRYAPENSIIRLTLGEMNGEITCAISDQGPGIPAEHLPYIFERFYRVDPARDRREGGAGLGLAIARSLVEAQQGSIRAESTLGKGTEITLGLPPAENCHQSA